MNIPQKNLKRSPRTINGVSIFKNLFIF
jgi:hypothetical protein